MIATGTPTRPPHGRRYASVESGDEHFVVKIFHTYLFKYGYHTVQITVVLL